MSLVAGLCLAPALPAGPAVAAPPELGAALAQPAPRPVAEGTPVNTITIQPSDEDASIESLPNYAPYTAERLLIGGGGSLSWRAALRFDLSTIPTGAQITGAQLGLYFDGYCLSPPDRPICGGTSHQLDVHRATASWASTTISDRVTYTPEVTGSYLLPSGAPQGWMGWPVTALVQAWRSGTPNYGLVITRHDEDAASSGPAPPGKRFTGSPALRPRLVVTYSSDAVQLAEPTTVHSTGAELSWTPYAGSAAFLRYEVHRGAGPGFVPSPATLVARIANRATTTYRDTTAAPSTTVTYKIVVNGAPSAARTVTLPPAGQVRTVLRLAPTPGRMTYLYYSTAVTNCANYGAMPHVWVGTSASARWRAVLAFDVGGIPRSSTVTSAVLSLWRLFGPTAPATVNLFRVTQPWTEGTGAASCTGDGATWYDAAPGQPWTGQGGVYDPVTVAAASVPADAASGSTVFTLTGLVRTWVAGASNNGVLLRLSDETLKAGNSVVYASDDYAAETSLRPTLTVTYTGT